MSQNKKNKEKENESSAFSSVKVRKYSLNLQKRKEAHQNKRKFIYKSNEGLHKGKSISVISQDLVYKKKMMTIKKQKDSPIDCRSSNSENLNDEDSEMFQSINTNALVSSPKIHDYSTT